MKGIDIKKDSWHYWVAGSFGWQRFRSVPNYIISADGKPYQTHDKVIENDFCSYVRRVIFGTMILSALALIVTVVIAFVFYTEFVTWRYNLLCVFYHTCKFTNLIGVGQVLWNVALVAVLVLLGGPKFLRYLKVRNTERYYTNQEKRVTRQDRRQARREARLLRKLGRSNKETFLKMAYRSIKDKICFRMNIQ